MNDVIMEGKRQKRTQWECDEDIRCIKRTFEILKDKELLAEVQEDIKRNNDAKKSMELFADGNIKEALGL